MIEFTKEQQVENGTYRKMYVKNGVVTLSNGNDYLSSRNYLGDVIKSYRDYVLYDEDGYYTLWNTKTDWIKSVTVNENYCDEDELPEAEAEKKALFKDFYDDSCYYADLCNGL